MGAVVCCPACGHVHQVILSDAEYSVRFPGNGVAGQPPPAAASVQAPVPPGRRQQPPQAAADTDAPICGRCGVHRVGRRRNGSYFATCYDCGG